MKKLLTAVCAIATATAASAKPYVGIVGGVSFINPKLNVKLTSNNTGRTVTEEQSMKFTNMILGGFAGYAFKINNDFSVLVEADAEYNFGSKNLKNQNIFLFVEDESYSFKKGFSFGVMPSVKYNFNETISSIFGVRFSLNQIKISAKHVGVADYSMISQTTNHFGIEPTVAIQTKLSDNLSGRLSAGYMFSQKKTAFNNYLNQNNRFKGAVNINPSSIRITGSLIYSF